MNSFLKLTHHTSNGLCRAVNVTGSATAVVAGGVFKLAGAAVLDAVGEPSAESKSAGSAQAVLGYQQCASSTGVLRTPYDVLEMRVNYHVATDCGTSYSAVVHTGVEPLEVLWG